MDQIPGTRSQITLESAVYSEVISYEEGRKFASVGNIPPPLGVV